MAESATQEPSVEVSVEMTGHVAVVEIHRPPHNFFDLELIQQLANEFERLDQDPQCRAIVLAAEGKSFCAGANFGKPRTAVALDPKDPTNPLYHEAIRLFACAKPVVAAVQGAAVGGGLGLAMVGDFRVACPEARFSANFTRLGFHPGFGLSVTLPRVIGHQKASLLMYTGRRIGGEEALAIGLVDFLVPQAELRAEALKLAQEIAISAPIAVQSTRVSLRRNLVDMIREAVVRESIEQRSQQASEDFREGIAAMNERRLPRFEGR